MSIRHFLMFHRQFFYAHAENCPKQGSVIYRQIQMVLARQSERINKISSHSLKLAWEDGSLSYCRCFAPYDHLKEAKPSCPASQACALKKKLPEHVRKVSYGSSEKMEITAKAAQRSALLIRGQESKAAERMLMNETARY